MWFRWVVESSWCLAVGSKTRFEPAKVKSASKIYECMNI